MLVKLHLSARLAFIAAIVSAELVLQHLLVLFAIGKELERRTLKIQRPE